MDENLYQKRRKHRGSIDCKQVALNYYRSVWEVAEKKVVGRVAQDIVFRTK